MSNAVLGKSEQAGKEAVLSARSAILQDLGILMSRTVQT
jgi:hypothetical protein